MNKSLLAAVLLLLTSCSGSKSFQPPKEKIYRLSVLGKLVSLNPFVTNDVYSATVQMLTYESLYQYKFLGDVTTLEPALATDFPKYSKDGKTLTITLKQGVHFQDDPCFKETGGKGREVVAQDFVNFFKLAAAKKFLSPMYINYEGIVEGIDDYRNEKTKEISGVKALDKYTIEIKTLKKRPRFINNFVSRYAPMIPLECVEYYGDELAHHAVGTGPFIIKKYSTTKAEAIKNPTYREDYYPSQATEEQRAQGLLADAGQKLPLVDKVVVEVIEEDSTSWLKFLAGEIEQIVVPKDNVDSVIKGKPAQEELEKRGAKLFTNPRQDVTFIFFNLKDSYFGKHSELRKAIAYSRNVPEFIHLGYADQAIAANSIIPFATYGFDLKYKNEFAERNIKKAKELLAKAGFPEGKGLPVFKVIGGSSSTLRQRFEIMQKHAAEIGIQMEYEPIAWPQFNQRAREGKFTLAMMAWAWSDYDADDIFVDLTTNSASNYTQYKNPELDKLLDQIQSLENGEARLSVIKKARDIVARDLPVIPVAHRIANVYFQPWVKNATFSDELFHAQYLKYRRVEAAK